LIFNFIDLLVYLKLNRVYNKMGCIYKISCKDENITDCYIGSTKDFKERKRHHKIVCNNKNDKDDKKYNSKVYKFIRENGGWGNWKMKIIEEIETDDKTELLKKEQEYLNLNNSSLNSVKNIYLTAEGKIEWYIKNKEKLNEYHKEYRSKNDDKMKELKKEWYEKNRDKVLEKQKKDNKEYQKAYRDKLKVKVQCPVCNNLYAKNYIKRHLCIKAV